MIILQYQSEIYKTWYPSCMYIIGYKSYILALTNSSLPFFVLGSLLLLLSTPYSASQNWSPLSMLGVLVAFNGFMAVLKGLCSELWLKPTGHRPCYMSIMAFKQFVIRLMWRSFSTPNLFSFMLIIHEEKGIVTALNFNWMKLGPWNHPQI